MRQDERVIRRRVVIGGRVQGVGFRYSCAREARSCEVRGWVRNLADGRVEAVLEGAENTVAALIEWMHAGPPGAHVTHLDVHEEEPVGEHDFEVR